jgi:hypothetical protein
MHSFHAPASQPWSFRSRVLSCTAVPSLRTGLPFLAAASQRCTRHARKPRRAASRRRARARAGRWAFRATWAYGAAMGGVFLVRTLKCVIFHEARRTAIDSRRHNYLLLALWLAQFPFCYYLAVLP